MQAYVRADSVVSRVIAGETMIVPIRKGVGDLASIYSLNGVASLVWSVIEQPSTLEQIISAVEDEFSHESEQIEQEIFSFLKEMCSLRLIFPSATGVAA